MSVRYEVHLDKSSGKINESCAESLAPSLKCGLDRKLCWVFDTISSALLIENTVTVYRHVRFKGFEWVFTIVYAGEFLYLKMSV